MSIFKTNCESITGRILYSDTYYYRPCDSQAPRELHRGQHRHEVVNEPMLNTIASIPILGLLAGAFRIILSIIHMIGHTLAALLYWDSGHMYHVAKGGAEFLRGIIEILPIVGRLFVWTQDALCTHRYIIRNCSCWYYGSSCYSFFLIRISNPDKRDNIDHCLDFQEGLRESYWRAGVSSPEDVEDHFPDCPLICEECLR